MKKLLILGGSELQVPMIRKAKTLGYCVAVVDFNNEAAGRRFSDYFYNISTNDIQGVIEVVKEFQPNGITTIATDMPVRTIAGVNDYLGTQEGLDSATAIRCTDKLKMIESLSSNNVSVPWFYLVDRTKKIEEDLEFPCIVKPVDSSGSRGVSTVNNIQELSSAIEYALEFSKEEEVLVEELLIGQEISVEVLVHKGKVNILAYTEKTTTGSPYFVELMHIQPANLSSLVKNKVDKLVKDSLFVLGVNHGPAHVEMMLTEKGPKIIEVGARLGGDFITTHLVELSTGIDIVGATIKQACGDDFSLESTMTKASIVKFFHSETYGKIKNIIVPSEALQIEGIKDICLFKNKGDYLGPINNSTSRLGAVIGQADNRKEALAICDEAIKQIKVLTL
ncbi:ATP-grasp domain-containing protein [Vagococcus sp. PNs007]|uniref:ATP-grasp domain-containing protein n=1 Tax=Vagococcus proximus TaxID=2991417 RepID=A0ABT5X000_9ENTE|nr:ATP-grasp domain-containing protein [Vagococcus proximus]MDF0479335.1 ATP-grasp domain-containing protein [Vagococcus proximus]